MSGNYIPGNVMLEGSFAFSVPNAPLKK